MATGLTLAALGDSLTASYAGQPYGAAGDQNWVQQLAAHDAGRLTIVDEAVAGATSADLLAPGNQVDTVADLVRRHEVRNAVLIVGANDVSAHLPDFLAHNRDAFVSQVVGNIETALGRLADAGPVRLVVGDIPDVTLTPGFQFQISQLPLAPADVVWLTRDISGAIAAANHQIEAFAAAAEIPVVDLNGLGKLAGPGPFVVGGVTIQGVNGFGAPAPFYSPDGFHPATVGQGVLGNAILEAFAEAGAPAFACLRLTDQQILDDAGVAHAPGRSFFDVRPYVLFAEGDDAGWAARHEALDQVFADCDCG
jgi:lysophospholipase L1-like esterase